MADPTPLPSPKPLLKIGPVYMWFLVLVTACLCCETKVECRRLWPTSADIKSGESSPLVSTSHVKQLPREISPFLSYPVFCRLNSGAEFHDGLVSKLGIALVF